MGNGLHHFMGLASAERQKLECFKLTTNKFFISATKWHGKGASSSKQAVTDLVI
jgi:hypothetical protein